MPLPMEAEFRVHASPVPTQTIFSFDGSRAMAPMDCTGCLSKTGLKVVPPSSDFQTPPLAAPTNTTVFPFSFRAVTAAMRPLIVAEPMLRTPKPLTTPESKRGAPALPRAAGGVELPGFTWLGASGAGAGVDRAASFVLGNWNRATSNLGFGSALSIVNRWLLGSPFPPDSIAKGIHTPAT